MKVGDRVFVKSVEVYGKQDGSRVDVQRRGTIFSGGHRRAWWVKLDARAENAVAHEYAIDDHQGRALSVECALTDMDEIVAPTADTLAGEVARQGIEIAKLRAEWNTFRQKSSR